MANISFSPFGPQSSSITAAQVLSLQANAGGFGSPIDPLSANNPMAAASLAQSALLSNSMLGSNWMTVLSSGFTNPDLSSVETPLSGGFANLTSPGLGNATNLSTLETPLRGGYAGMLFGTAGGTDDFNQLQAPLASAYSQQMPDFDMLIQAVMANPNAANQIAAQANAQQLSGGLGVAQQAAAAQQAQGGAQPT